MAAESLEVKLSVPLGMRRMYLAEPVDRRMPNALFPEVPDDEEEDEDEIKDDEEEDDEGEEGDEEEEGEGYSE